MIFSMKTGNWIYVFLACTTEVLQLCHGLQSCVDQYAINTLTNVFKTVFR